MWNAVGFRALSAGLVLATQFLLVACGGGDEGEPPPGVPVQLVLVESTAAPPAQIDGQCVVFTERPQAQELSNYQWGRVPAVFEQVGSSVRRCMEGDAASYLSALPTTVFFEQQLFINLDGRCPPGYSGCYYPDNPTVDLLQTVLSLIPAVAERHLDMLVGHEIWHAVDGHFHP